MKRSISTLLFCLIALLGLAAAAATATPAAAAAQTPEFRLHSQRVFGYGSGSDVRGNFNFSIYGTQETIQSVTYLIDGKEMGTVSAQPFTYAFRTTDFPDGWHDCSAQVTTKDGRTVATPVVRLNFLSAAQESQSMSKIVLPLFLGVGAALLIGVGVQVLILRKNPDRVAAGAPRHYGIKGGTICSKCGHPYPIHFFSLNLPGGYFDRCDFCGKWAFVRPRSQAELAAAEQAELHAFQASENSLPGAENGETEEERLRKLLDESRYTK